MAIVAHVVLSGDGRTFHGNPGVIESTELGQESDYRFYVGTVAIKFDHAVQSFAPSLGGTSTPTSDAMHRHVNGVLKAAKVRIWEDLVGKEIMALYAHDDPTCTSMILGICSVDGENIYLVESL